MKPAKTRLDLALERELDLKERLHGAERGVKTLLGVIAELIVAAEMGECPRADCPTCARKFAAIKRGKETLELMKAELEVAR